MILEEEESNILQFTDKFSSLDMLRTQIQKSAQSCIECVDMLDDKIFTDAADGYSSIGAHMRHIIDRINCFIAGVKTGVICYDKRQRSLQMEQSRNLCKLGLERIVLFFDSFNIQHIQQDIVLQETISMDNEQAVIKTTAQREIHGLIIHNTHHLATIRLILKIHGVESPSSLGKAISTIIYENQCN